MRGIAPESCYSALNVKGCFHVFFRVIVDICKRQQRGCQRRGVPCDLYTCGPHWPMSTRDEGRKGQNPPSCRPLRASNDKPM